MGTVIRLLWAIVQRALVPIVLVGAGIALVVYGAAYHTVEVAEEQEIEIEVEPPMPFGPEFPGDDPELGGPPGFGPPGLEPPELAPPFPIVQPPPDFAKRQVKVLVTEVEREPVVIREVTIGGLVLLEPGTLERTYSGKPPSLCPT
jgi:hypothetical protein